MSHDESHLRPWYRQTAPWLLMAGPVAVVVAGGFTFWLALSHPDGLVADDYYKRGLLVERRLEREQAAAKAGLRARLIADPQAQRVAIEIGGATGISTRWTLLLRHAARPELDRRLDLVEMAPGRFEAPAAPLPAGRWGVVLESDTLRLDGLWHWPQARELTLGAGQ